jgi:hypothetical protein
VLTPQSAHTDFCGHAYNIGADEEPISVDWTEANHTEHAEEAKAAILEQLERLLTSPYFNHSRRIPSFLKFVVEQTVSGQTDPLKERTLGMEVFGRDPDYDTGSDSIVRVTAADLRKRIAQYYLEPGHENELRISLTSGSYIPHFHWPGTFRETEESQLAADPALATVPAEWPPTSGGKRSQNHLRLIIWIVLVATGVLGAGTMLYRKSMSRPPSVDSFWTPVLSTGDPVLFCIGDQNQHLELTLLDADDARHQITLRSNLTTAVIDDLSPIVRIGSILQSNGKKYSIKGQGSTNLADLRNGPTVYLGAFDNAWTLWITKSLRYHFANNPEMTHFGIIDSKSLSPMHWMINRQQQANTNN